MPGTDSLSPLTSTRGLLLVGANPGLRLYDEGATLTAYASVWVVDWSTHGRGTVLVLWRDGAVRLLGENEDLARWLESHFVRHFPEADGLTWSEPTYEDVPVSVHLDVERGIGAVAGDIELSMSEVLDLRPFRTESFDLDGHPHTLSLVHLPVGSARLSVGGVRVPGDVRVETVDGTAQSSGFLAVAEVWSDPAPTLG